MEINRDYDNTLEEDVVYCKRCKHQLKHDRWFGYCKLHKQQVKFNETCSQGVSRYG